MHTAPRANKSVQNLPPWKSINWNSQTMVGLSNRVEPSQPQAIRDKTSDIGHLISLILKREGPFPDVSLLRWILFRFSSWCQSRYWGPDLILCSVKSCEVLMCVFWVLFLTCVQEQEGGMNGWLACIWQGLTQRGDRQTHTWVPYGDRPSWYHLACSETSNQGWFSSRTFGCSWLILNRVEF